MYYVDVHLNWLNWFHFLVIVVGPIVIAMACMTFLLSFKDVASICISTFSFLVQLDPGIISRWNAFICFVNQRVLSLGLTGTFYLLPSCMFLFFLFLFSPYFVVAFQLCVEWIPSDKKVSCIIFAVFYVTVVHEQKTRNS